MDRNVNLRVVDGSKSVSLSARRAWIEILLLAAGVMLGAVALRKESVDRNTRCASNRFNVPLSLSARRAWIEILCSLLMLWPFRRRSPQGERG